MGCSGFIGLDVQVCMCTDTNYIETGSLWMDIPLLPLATANLDFVSLFLNTVAQAKCISRGRKPGEMVEISVEFLPSSAALPDSGVG